MEDQDDGATEAARDVTAEMDKSGEIQVKGPGVFKEWVGFFCFHEDRPG